MKNSKGGSLSRRGVKVVTLAIVVTACGSPQDGADGGAGLPAGPDDESSAPEPDPPSSSPSEVLVISNRAGNYDIYVIGAESGELRQLTHDPAEDRFAVWAPDGNQILFTSARDGNYDLYVIGADGHDLRRLTHHAADDFAGGWSPDGQHILFTSQRDGNREVYIMRTDGTGLERLTYNQHDDVLTGLSPNGTEVGFTRTEVAEETGIGERALYLMHLSARAERRLTTGLVGIWSPDGERIAFTDVQPSGFTAVFMIQPDGSERQLLWGLPDGWASAGPWLPSGRHMVILVMPSVEDCELYVLDVTSKEASQLTESEGCDRAAFISPNGEQLAFTRFDGAEGDVFVMNVDGTGLRRLTDHPANDGARAWRPISP